MRLEHVVIVYVAGCVAALDLFAPNSGRVFFSRGELLVMICLWPIVVPLFILVKFYDWFTDN